MFSARALPLVVGCWFAATSCASDTKGGDRDPVGPSGGGAAGTMATGGAPPIGGSGGVAGTAGTGGVPPTMPPPVVDASAPPFMRDDTATSGLDPGVIDTLKKGGAACSNTVTFPYQGTMFPGGLQAPIIMWQGASDAAYVRFAYDMSDKVDYQFATGPSSPGELQIPRDAWNEITRRTNQIDLIVTLSTMNGGAVSTCELRWRIAPGNMVGAVYYNTYQAPTGVVNQGAVMRLSLGSPAEVYKQHTGAINLIALTGPCYSCHSMSFDGTTMIASYHDYQTKMFRVESFNVDMNVQPPPASTVHNANFGALTPNGDRILAMGNPECTGGSETFPRKPDNFPLVEGVAVARVLETSTGNDTRATGLQADHYMWMPQFSPSGDKVVFNHAKPDGSGGTDRRELAVMDYDYATNTFSNLRVVVSASRIAGVSNPTLAYSPVGTGAGLVPCDAAMCGGLCPPTPPGAELGALPMGTCNGPCYPAWPFFTPDGLGVVFSMVSEPDFTNAFPGRDKPSVSDLWYVDVDTLEVLRMTKANKGLFPADETANYYPTVMPIAVGGYFWVFWTAVRDYGHKVMGRGMGGPPNSAAEAHKKRIWVSAIRPKNVMAEISVPLTDPSLPGFYLDGQSESGNVRAFAALNPCLAEGQTCNSGIDCCCGYCLAEEGQSTGKCGCEVPMCAKLNEKCTTNEDCCPPEKGQPVPMCLGGFCGFIVLE